MSDALKNQFIDGVTLGDICDRISSGTSVRSLAKEYGVSEFKLRWWLAKDENVSHSARARDIGCDSISEQVLEIADNPDIDPAHKRVMVDSRIRLLGKWSQRYSDKQQVEHSGNITVEAVSYADTNPK